MAAANTFKITGIEVRTTNRNNLAMDDLGLLWQRFYAEKVAEKINNKSNNNIYVVYTDYESNYTGAYTAIIGCKVNSIGNISDGLTARSFPGEYFMKFSAKGLMPQAIIDAWQNIWKQDAQLNRKYTYDFEVYPENIAFGEKSEADIFISIHL